MKDISAIKDIYEKKFNKGIVFATGRKKGEPFGRYDIQDLFKAAYRRLTPDIGCKKVHCTENFAECKLRAKFMLCDMFTEYFTSACKASQEEFDAWHKAACKKYLACYDRAIDLDGAPITFANAQKKINTLFVNMLLYLCLLEGTQTENGETVFPLREYFEFCHMPFNGKSIDIFIYNFKSTKADLEEEWARLADYNYYFKKQTEIRDGYNLEVTYDGYFIECLAENDVL